MKDLLRRRSGGRWPPRWWDRGLWICGVVMALLFMSVAVWSIAALALGSEVNATVRSCSTTFHFTGRFGRHATSCDVTLSDGDPATVHAVDMAQRHKAGDEVTLTTFRHTLSDPKLDSGYAWLLPVGVAVLGATWWMGLPSRRDTTVGRHARSPRKRRCPRATPD